MANRLLEILKAKGISQKAFAQMVGTSPQYISAVGSGKITISIKQLSKFAEALGIPVSGLLLKDNETAIFYCPHCGMPIKAISIENEEEMD